MKIKSQKAENQAFTDLSTLKKPTIQYKECLCISTVFVVSHSDAMADKEL